MPKIAPRKVGRRELIENLACKAEGAPVRVIKMASDGINKFRWKLVHSGLVLMVMGDFKRQGEVKQVWLDNLVRK